MKKIEKIEELEEQIDNLEQTVKFLQKRKQELWEDREKLAEIILENCEKEQKQKVDEILTD